MSQPARLAQPIGDARPERKLHEADEPSASALRQMREQRIRHALRGLVGQPVAIRIRTRRTRQLDLLDAGLDVTRRELAAERMLREQHFVAASNELPGELLRALDAEAPFEDRQADDRVARRRTGAAQDGRRRGLRRRRARRRRLQDRCSAVRGACTRSSDRARCINHFPAASRRLPRGNNAKRILYSCCSTAQPVLLLMPLKLRIAPGELCLGEASARMIAASRSPS